MDLAFDATNDADGLAEVRLGVPRRMHQRHEHLLGPLPPRQAIPDCLIGSGGTPGGTSGSGGFGGSGIGSARLGGMSGGRGGGGTGSGTPAPPSPLLANFSASEVTA